MYIFAALICLKSLSSNNMKPSYLIGTARIDSATIYISLSGETESYLLP